MRQLAVALSDVKDQWQATPRLRVVTYLALAVAILGLFLRLADWKDEQVSQAAAAHQQLVSAKSVVTETGWVERERQAEGGLKVAREHIWSAPSAGAAQALLRDALSRIARANDLDIGRLALTSRPLEELALTEVRAEFRGQYKPGQWQSFVGELTALRPSLRFDFEQINRDGSGRHTWRMAVSAVFDITPEGS